ncbi:MAG: DUF58 domain-containing protein [Myxococcota bacterium]
MGADAAGLRMTAAGGGCSLLCAGAIFIAVSTGDLQAACLAITLGIMLAISAPVAWLNLVGVSARRQLPDEIFAARTAVGQLVLSNQGPVRSVAVFVEDAFGATAVLDGLPRDAEIGAPTRWRFAHRGRMQLGSIRFKSQFPFGLFESWRTVQRPCEVVVFPTPLPAPAVRSDAARQVGGELVGLREYAPGDPLRWVHWPTSARVGQPMVALREEPIDPQIVVTVAEAVGVEWERSLSEASGQIDAWSRRGAAVGMRMGDRAWPPRASARWRRMLLEQLALAEARP